MGRDGVGDIIEHTETVGSIHDPIPVPEGEGWKRVYHGLMFGKVKGSEGDSPGRYYK